MITITNQQKETSRCSKLYRRPKILKPLMPIRPRTRHIEDRYLILKYRYHPSKIQASFKLKRVAQEFLKMDTKTTKSTKSKPRNKKNNTKINIR